MTSYYRCDGSIVDDGYGGLQCSSGWLVVDEPVYSLMSQEQASDLIIAVVMLWALVKVYNVLFNLFGVQK